MLTVTDDKGGVDTADRDRAGEPGQRRTCGGDHGDAGVRQVAQRGDLHLHGVGLRRHDRLHLVWDFGDGSPTSTNPNPAHTYGVGVFIATCTVTDDDGATTTRSVEIRSLPNVPPVAAASATPSSGRAPLAVQLSSAGSIDYDGSIAGYSWNFGDGSPVSTSPNPSHVYAAGTWTATADGDRQRGCDAQRIGAGPEPGRTRRPTAVANGTPIGINNKAPYTVEFSSAGSVDNDCAVVNACPGLTYSWDFGDGSPVSTEAEPDPHLHRCRRLRRHADGDRQRRCHRRQGSDHQRRQPERAAGAPAGCQHHRRTCAARGGLRPRPARSTPTVSIVSTIWDFGDGSPLETTADATPHLRPRHLDRHADRHRRRRCQRDHVDDDQLDGQPGAGRPGGRDAGQLAGSGRGRRSARPAPTTTTARSCSYAWDFGDGEHLE